MKTVKAIKPHTLDVHEEHGGFKSLNVNLDEHHQRINQIFKKNN